MIEKFQECSLTEFVGSGIGDTVGIVIANLDAGLCEKIKLDNRFRSVGVVSARIGGGTHVMAADSAVKATNTEIVSIEFSRDTKGGAGHGITVIFGSEDVSDARRAVEVMLEELDEQFGNVYVCDAGHLQLHYTARASYALNHAFDAPMGKAFGISIGAPAAVGLIMADAAMKSGNIEISKYASPMQGTSYTNEIIITFSGDASAVMQALLAARKVGFAVLKGMGQTPVSMTNPTW